MGSQIEEPVSNEASASAWGKAIKKRLSFFLVFCGASGIFILITDYYHILTEGSLNLIVAIVASVAQVGAWFLPPEVLDDLSHLPSRLSGLLAKHKKIHILINYIDQDKYWMEWVKYKLEQRGYVPVPLKWDGTGDFVQKLLRAEKKVKWTLSIMSTETIDLLEELEKLNRQWVHDWKSRNHIDTMNAVLCVRRVAYEKLQEDADNPLRLLYFAYGAKEKTTEAEAENQLKLWLIENGQTLQQTEQTEKHYCYPRKRPEGWNLPERNPNFSGRRALLARLQKQLVSPNARVVLSGLAGNGKTEIVREYAYRNYDRYRYVFWLDVDTPQYISQLKAINEALRIQQENTLSEQDAFIAWLRKEDGWLLIIDGYCESWESRKNLEKFLGLDGKLLIIVRMGSTPPNIRSKHMVVDSMDEDEAIALMKKDVPTENQTFSPEEEKAIRAIVKRLGSVPEALLAANLYIRYNKCSFTQYMRDYQEVREEYAQKKKALGQQASANQVPEEQVDIVYTWWLYFDEIQRTSPEAARILQYCCMLDPVTIYRDIIEHIPNRGLSGSQLTGAIGKLVRHCLLIQKQEDETLSVEPHIKNVFYDWLDDNTKRSLFIDIIQALSKALEPLSIPNMQRAQVYALQFDTCKTFIESYKIEQIEVADFYDIYGHYLTELANYKEAVKLLDESWEMRERLDQQMFNGSINNSIENQWKLKKAANRSYKAELLYMQGKYKDAQQLLETEVLPVQEKHLGKYHMEVATTYYSLARLAYILGASHSAFHDYYHTLVTIWQDLQNQKLSPDSKIALLKQQGSIYYMRKDYPESIKKYKDAIATAQQAMRTTWGLEKQAFEKEVDICQAQVGRCRVASMKQDADNSDLCNEINKIYRKALYLYRSVYNDIHPHIAQIFINLGDLHKIQGKRHSGQAKRYYNKAIFIYGCIQIDHPQIKQTEFTIDSLSKQTNRRWKFLR